MFLVRWLACLLLLTAATQAAAQAAELPALGADAKRTSVSGLSSGAFMAGQYAVTFSSETIGAGIVAGGTYGCGVSGLGVALICMQGSPSGAFAYNRALGFATWGMIDPTDNIARQRIYLFSGTKDGIVKQSAMNAVRDFYVDLKVSAANLVYVHDVPAGHAFISDDLGQACAKSEGDFINQCTVAGALYDQPHAILSHIYGTLAAKAATLSAAAAPFDQRPYLPATARMADTGYVYVPAACRSGGCAVHVVFHGCGQSEARVGDDVYARVGYNEWADTNRIVMLYPQVDASAFNPQGCWDWWGYTAPTIFPTRYGAQLKAVHAMVARLAERP